MSFVPNGQSDIPFADDPYFNLTASPDRFHIKASPAEIVAYLGELTRAIQKLHDPLTAPQLLSLIRLWSTQQAVGHQLQYEPLGTFAHLGHEVDVLALASAFPRHDSSQLSMFAIVAESLARRKQLTPTLLDTLLNVPRHLVDNQRAAAFMQMLWWLWPIDQAQAEALLPEAIASANAIREAWTHVNTLKYLAKLIATSHPDRAIGLLNDALIAVRNDDGAWSNALQLCDIATTLISLDREKAVAVFDEAHEAAERISDEEAYYSINDGTSDAPVSLEEKTIALRKLIHLRITEAQRRGGIIPVDQTLQDARMTDDVYARVSVLVQTVPELARTGDSRFATVFDELVTLIQAVEPRRQSYWFRRVREACLKAERFAEAWAVEQMLDVDQTPLKRWQMTTRFLNSIPDSVATSQFADLLEEAIAYVTSLPAATPDADPSAGKSADYMEDVHDTLRNGLFILIHLLIYMDDKRVHPLMAQALAIPATPSETLSPMYLDEVRAAWAVALIDAGQLNIAETLIAALPEQNRIAPLCALLSVYLAAHDPRAERLLADLLHTIDQQNDRGYIDPLLSVVQVLATGKDDRAPGLLDKALALARSFQSQEDYQSYWNPSLRHTAGALGDIAMTMGLIGDPRCDQIFDEALTVLATVTHDPPRRETLRGFVDRLTRAGRIDRALAIAYDDIDSDKRDKSIVTVMEILAEAGKAGQVRAIIADYAARGLNADPDWASYIVIALANAGLYQAAQAEMKGKVFSEWQRNDTNEALATALAREGQFVEAFAQLGTWLPGNRVSFIVKWTAMFERVQPGLSIAAIREITRITGWGCPEWLALTQGI